MASSTLPRIVSDETPDFPSRTTTDIDITEPGDDDLHVGPEIDCAAVGGTTDDTTAHLRTHIHSDTDRDDPTTDDIDHPDDDPDDDDNPWPIERDDGFYATSGGTFTFLWFGWCVTMARAGRDADHTPLYRVAERRLLPTRDPRPAYLGA